MDSGRLQPALLGGVFIGVMSSLPIVNIGNCCCCLWVLAGGALAVTVYGADQMYKVVSLGGTTTLVWALLVLFVANFSWIALAFTSSLVGFAWMLFFAPKPPGIPAALTTKTAVVMPIYNETPERVFAALQAMIEEVEATGLGRS